MLEKNTQLNIQVLLLQKEDKFPFLMKEKRKYALDVTSMCLCSLHVYIFPHCRTITLHEYPIRERQAHEKLTK